MQKNQIQTCCFLLLFLISTSICAALLPTTVQSPFNHLKEINAEWQYHQDALPTEAVVVFDKDVDRIQYHLRLVIDYLSKHNLPNNTVIRQNRLNLLSELATYTDQKVFPTNLYHLERTPYFIDDYGVHCAVGYLIKISGHEALAQQIKQQHNYDYIRDIKTPGVQEWADQHGFTLDELAWIQPGYPGALIDVSYISGFTNGSIKGSHVDKRNDVLITYGTFTEVNKEACGGLVYTKDLESYCLNKEFTGEIHAVAGDLDTLLVGGIINHENDTFSLAIYRNKKWTFYANEKFKTYNAKMIHKTNNNQYYVCFEVSQGSFELWKFNNDLSEQEFHLSFEGEINEIESINGKVYLAGLFGKLKFNHLVYKLTRNITHSVVLEIDGSDARNIYNSFFSVKTVKGVNSKVFIGHSIHSTSGHSNLPLVSIYDPLIQQDSTLFTTREFYLNSSHPDPFEFMDTFSINSFEIYRNRYLMIGGHFEYSDFQGIGTTAHNCVLFDLTKENTLQYVTPLSPKYLGVVQSYDFLSDSLMYMSYSNSLVKYNHPVSLQSVEKTNISISPNPFTNSISVSGLDTDEFNFVLQDLSGRVIEVGKSSGEIQLDKSVAPGVYNITIESNGQTYNRKLIKE